MAAPVLHERLEPYRNIDRPNATRLSIHSYNEPPHLERHVPLDQGVKSFESLKQSIEYLYLTLNLPTKDVIRVMKETQGFSATYMDYPKIPHRFSY